jgi:hypothetical protein
MIIIFNIINSLVSDNKEIIINETDFIDHHIHLLNSVPNIIIKIEYLYPLYSIIEYSPNEQNKKLFEKGVIQTMTNIYDSIGYYVR